MFQFTREFIINNNEGNLTGSKRFIVDTNAKGEKVLKVDHMVNIKASDVACAYSSEGAEEKIEKVTITAPTVAAGTLAVGDVVRLVLVLGQEGRVVSTYNDYYPDHTRTFVYEAKATAVDTVPLAGLLAAMQAEKARFENVFFSVAGSTSGTNIVIDAADCYTRVHEVKIVKVPTDNASLIGEKLTGYLDYDVIVSATRKELLTAPVNGVTLTQAGSLGKGTTNYIIHNMRLQSAANLNPYGVNMDERPLPRSIYDQYTVELVTERRHIGHQVMGAIDHSLVTVIFFVLQGETSTAFADALAQVATVEIFAPVAATPYEGPAQIVAMDKDVKAAAETADAAAEAAEEAAKPGDAVKVTLPATSVDGTNPTEDVELEGTIAEA